MSESSFSAPGTDDFSIFDRLEFALRNLPPWPASCDEADEPTVMISLVRSSVRSIPVDSAASPLMRLLLSEELRDVLDFI